MQGSPVAFVNAVQEYPRFYMELIMSNLVYYVGDSILVLSGFDCDNYDIFLNEYVNRSQRILHVDCIMASLYTKY